MKLAGNGDDAATGHLANPIVTRGPVEWASLFAAVLPAEIVWNIGDNSAGMLQHLQPRPRASIAPFSRHLVGNGE
jgi:hypothetical protein